MEFTRAIVVLLVCGAFSSACSADVSNRRMLSSLTDAEAAAASYCVSLGPAHLLYYSNQKCFTITNAEVGYFSAEAQSLSVALSDENLAKALADAAAYGSNAQASTTTNSYVAPGVASSSSNSYASAGRK